MQGLGRTALVALVSTLAVVVAPAAADAAPQNVRALGVDKEGNTYAATWGSIEVLNTSGSLIRRFGTIGTGPGQVADISAVSVDPDNHVWVLDSSNRVQEFTREGTYLRGFSVGPCTETADAFIRGGVDVSSQYIFVASVCADQVIRVNKSDFGGRISWAVDNPDGLSYNQYASCGYKLAVARPQSQDVLLFDVDGTPKGSRTVAGRVPDVYLDDFGVVMASDNTRDQIHFYGCDGVEFRTLGGAGAAAGKLDNALAFDVFGQYGGDLAGNLFIGEFNNARVQRWSSGGYTFFASPLDGANVPGGGGPGPDPDPDPEPPTPSGPVGISIGYYAAFVNSPDVQLRIHAPAGSTGVQISNDGGFEFAQTKPLEADSDYSWTLPVSGLSERLPRTVYVRFPGSANPTQTYSDDIILDTTPPGLRSVALKGTSLRVSARDGISGVSAVQVATGTGASAKRLTVKYGSKAITVTRKLGKRPYVRVLDRAGNASKWKRVTRK